MANWYGTARSNYFRVKDEVAFKKWVETLGEITLFTHDDKPGLFALASRGEFGDWPNWRFTSDGTDSEHLDLLEELWPHLAQGEVAVIMESGAEKLRYVTGWSEAVNWHGKRVAVHLDDIYAKAAKAFRVPVKKITQATY